MLAARVHSERGFRITRTSKRSEREENTMRRQVTLAVILVAVVTIGLGHPFIRGQAGAQISYQWKFGHVTSTTSDYQELATKFAELMERKTKGQVKITVHPAGQLGGEADMFKQVKGGALEFAIHGTPGLAALGVKEAMLFDLPYVVTTREQGWKLVNGEFGDWFREVVRTKTGVKPLGFLDYGFRHVYNRVRAIEKPEDLKGIKLRVLPAPGYVTAYEAFGVKSTPMAYTEVYQALQQGVIDGGEATPKQVVNDKLMEVAKYFSLTSITYNPIVLLTNDAFYQSLPEGIRKSLDEATREALAFHSQLSRKMDEDMLGVIKQAGVKVNEPKLEPFVKLVKPAVWDKLQADIPNGKQNVERLLKAVEAAKQ
jgi:C4-dicarboxylate-binding protein DctP